MNGNAHSKEGWETVNGRPASSVLRGISRARRTLNAQPLTQTTSSLWQTPPLRRRPSRPAPGLCHRSCCGWEHRLPADRCAAVFHPPHGPPPVRWHRRSYAWTGRCAYARSEEHTSELQSRENLVCRLLLEKKNNMVGTCADNSGEYYDHVSLMVDIAHLLLAVK